MKRSARGFDQVGHFFLSGDGSKRAEAPSASSFTDPPQPTQTIVPPREMGPAKNLESADAVPPVRRIANVSPSQRNTEHPITRLNQACFHISSTVARLEILKRASQGAALAEECPSDRAVWLRGAAAIIQESMAILSEMIKPVCAPVSSSEVKDEAEDGA